MDRSVSIMRNRVDKLGVSSPEIRKQSTNQIVIQLAGGPRPGAGGWDHRPDRPARALRPRARARAAVGRRGAGNPVAFTNLYNLLSRVQGSAKSGKPTGYVLFKPRQDVSKTTTGKGKNKKTKTTTNTVWVKVAGPIATLHRDPTTGNAGLLDPYKGKTPKGWKVLPVPAGTTVITCRGGRGPRGRLPGRRTRRAAARQGRLLPLQARRVPDRPERPVPEHDRQGAEALRHAAGLRPVERLADRARCSSTGRATRILPQVTRNEALRGQIRKQSQHFAIVLDNEIRSFPQIDYKQYGRHGIDPTGGGAQITGLQSLDEAKNLALVLQTGALPVKFVTVERTDVSATLGKDSLKQARNAAIAGLLLVALFLLILYRFLGARRGARPRHLRGVHVRARSCSSASR